MRNSVIVLLGLLCAFAAAESIFAVNKQEIGVFTELQSIDGSDFGKKLLDTISLQLKNKSPLGDISKLLHDIEEELKTQQNKADAEENAAEKACAKGVRNYNQRIAAATQQINEELVSIASYKSAIQSYETQQATYKSQIKILQDREASFHAAYKQDQADHQKRAAQQRAVIAALDQIVPELERLKPHGNVQQALVELAKIGRANPIGALLQVAMTLDPGALQRVIQHLVKLKKSVQASIVDDENAQKTASANYKSMVEEFQKEKNNLNEALARVTSDIESTKTKLATSQRILANAQKELKISRKGKEQLISQCDARKSRYLGQKAARAKEIKVVQDVLKIIATRLENMQDYIKKRVN